MREAIHLLRAALGNPDFSSPQRRVQQEIGSFRYFTVDLPQPQFRGFPPRWDFAVLLRPNNPTNKDRAKEFVKEAQALIDRLERAPANERTPLAIISDDPDVHLSDDLPYGSRNVFYLDAPQLPAVQRTAQARFTPLIRAVRNKLTTYEVSALSFSPYIRNKPATEWRFVGRHKELERIVESPENYMIVGARRVGKSSLCIELTRRFEASGQRVYLVDVQDCLDERSVVTRLLSVISPSDAASAIRRQKALDETLLDSVLKKITAGGGAVLILDELGNVIANKPSAEWRMMGVLRNHAQIGRLKLIFTCFQELFLRQQNEFAGPFVNLATTLRLRVFSPSEVEDLVLAPLAVWGPVKNERAFMDLVLSKIGRHPLFLQYFCSGLFDTVSRTDVDLLLCAQGMLAKDPFLACFSEAVEEVFYRMPSPTLKYIFLRHCREVDLAGKPLNTVIDDDWVAGALQEVGYGSTTIVRRNLLEGLEIRGLTEPVGENHSLQAIVTPVVYRFVKSAEPNLDKYVQKLQCEMAFEADAWNLQRIP